MVFQVGVSFYADSVFNTHPNGFNISSFMSEEELRSAVSDMVVPAGIPEDVLESLNEILSNGFSSTWSDITNY